MQLQNEKKGKMTKMAELIQAEIKSEPESELESHTE